MSRRLIGTALACALLFALPVAPVHGKKAGGKAPAWGGEDAPLRPGSPASTTAGSCTFNFVFYAPGKTAKSATAYIGTAGHCTEKVGDRVSHAELGEIGTVVYDSDVVESPVDFTLIQIDKAMVGKTNPTVLNWGGPTRSITQEDLAVGDQVDVYGYGVGVGQLEQTRPRQGVLVNWTEQEYQANMPAVNGDSGAPLIHHETGAALGIISRYGFTVPPSTDLGPLMPWILEELGKAGFNVKLATVKA